MTETTPLLTSTYLGPAEYYHYIACEKPVWVEVCDHYRKQTLRNRCIIASPNGPQALTIPVEKWEGNKCQMKDVRISDHGNWRHLHWNALESAYRTSPFFEYYADDLHPFYEKKWDFLCDFNEELCRLVCEWIDVNPQLFHTQAYGETNGNKPIIDLRNWAEKNAPTVCHDGYSVPQYYQVFQHKQGFVPHLSIIDMVFNMGPESLLLLRNKR